MHTVQLQRPETEKKNSGRGDHNGVGVTFICTQNGVCVGPGPPSLILYQLTPTPHPQTHTHEHSRGGNWLTPDTLFSFYSSPSLLPLLSQDLLHSSSWVFLKLQVWSFLVTKEEDEDRDVRGGALCVCVIYHPLFPIVSAALQEPFRLSLVARVCDVMCVCAWERKIMMLCWYLNQIFPKNGTNRCSFVLYYMLYKSCMVCVYCIKVVIWNNEVVLSLIIHKFHP